jgi:hypothetical protein
MVVAGAVVAGVAIVFRGRTGDRSLYAQRLVTVHVVSVTDGP